MRVIFSDSELEIIAEKIANKGCGSYCIEFDDLGFLMSLSYELQLNGYNERDTNAYVITLVNLTIKTITIDSTVVDFSLDMGKLEDYILQ